jgi:hypothetical protein
VGFCEHDAESWGSMKSGKNIGQLSEYQFLIKGSAAWRYLDRKGQKTELSIHIYTYISYHSHKLILYDGTRV